MPTSFAKRDPPSATPSLVFPLLHRARCTKTSSPPLRSRLSLRYVKSSGVPTRPWTGMCASGGQIQNGRWAGSYSSAVDRDPFMIIRTV